MLIFLPYHYTTTANRHISEKLVVFFWVTLPFLNNKKSGDEGHVVLAGTPEHGTPAHPRTLPKPGTSTRKPGTPHKTRKTQENQEHLPKNPEHPKHYLLNQETKITPTLENGFTL